MALTRKTVQEKMALVEEFNGQKSELEVTQLGQFMTNQPRYSPSLYTYIDSLLVNNILLERASKKGKVIDYPITSNGSRPVSNQNC